jgi:sigma-E factor negative regulatory protein RseA
MNIQERVASGVDAEMPRLQVSALVDGELDEAVIQRTIDALLASDDLAQFWADAHRAGDWMRSEEVVGVGDGGLFLRKFSAQLASEPTVLAPQAGIRFRSKRFWVRTGLPSASVAAALVVVAWVAMPFGRDAGADKSASATPTVMIVPVAASEGDVAGRTTLRTVDPERLSDYFAAHRDVTPFGYRGAAARPAAYSQSVGSTDAAPSQ